MGHLREILSANGVSPEAADPWLAWRLFKAFLRQPVEDALDDGLVQYGTYEEKDGRVAPHLYFVRQFSEVRVSALHDDEPSNACTHLVCEFCYHPDVIPEVACREIWTMDVSHLGQFVDRVESDVHVQALLGAQPVWSAVYLEEN
jgi:hypothetical protein